MSFSFPLAGAQRAHLHKLVLKEIVGEALPALNNLHICWKHRTPSGGWLLGGISAASRSASGSHRGPTRITKMVCFGFKVLSFMRRLCAH